jgi:hypothetical protein
MRKESAVLRNLLVLGATIIALVMVTILIARYLL